MRFIASNRNYIIGEFVQECPMNRQYKKQYYTVEANIFYIPFLKVKLFYNHKSVTDSFFVNLGMLNSPVDFKNCMMIPIGVRYELESETTP